MPPKARITKEMVIEAGLSIVRMEGQESLNVRRIAAELDCSTQPVMYHFKTVDELKAEIYDAADGLHTEYIVSGYEGIENPILSIGLNYIRFAEKEKHLFRFLFQSDKFRNIGLSELLDDETEFLIRPLAEHSGLTHEQAKKVFETLFVCAHGFASLLANNSMEYNEARCAELLINAYVSVVEHMKWGEAK